MLYFHVLGGNSQQDPAVVISGQDVEELLFPISTVLTEHDLYVADTYSGSVLIWRDYRTTSRRQSLTAGVRPNRTSY